MAPDTQNASTVETADLEELATSEISDLVAEDLDGVTQDKGFRQATTMLLAGKITVPEWEWFAVRAINKRVDIPYVSEASERDLFATAFEALGQALESLLLQGGTEAQNEFRAATVDLLRGEHTVDAWMEVAGEGLDTLIDIPYVPAVGEELLFDRGLQLLAKALHGLLVGSSEKANSGDEADAGS